MKFTDPNLPSVKHFRDVAMSINCIAKKELLKEGNLFIGSDITDAAEAENEYLRSTLRIRTVVDTAWETARTKAPVPEQSNLRQPRSWLNITRCLGLTYCGVKWRRGPYMDQLMSELSLWQQTKLCGNAMLEDQVRTNTLLTSAARSAGATKESFRVLDASKAMIGESWNEIFGKEASYPILMIGNRDSCIFLIVVLLFLEVPMGIISREIEQSSIHVHSIVGLPPDEASIDFLRNYVQSSAAWPGDMKRWLDEKYGGVADYLMAAGVAAKTQDVVQGMLLVDPDEKLVEL